MERRNAIKSLGTLSLGIAAPSLANVEKLVAPYKIQKKSIITDILVVGGGTAGTIAAIQAGRSHLNSDTLQFALFSIYKKANHPIKRMIVEKLMEAPYLSSELITSSRKLLGEWNGKQLGDFLKLYTTHAINDLETLEAVGEILKNENSFIARQAYNFLKESNISDKEIEELKNK